WRAAGRVGGAADSAAASPSAGFAWARVQQAVAAFPGQPLVVVTSAALRNFEGTHKPLPAAVRWQVLPDTTTTAWLAAAQIIGDSLQLLVGHSSETLTRFRREKVLAQRNGRPMRVPGLPPVCLQPGSNGGTNMLLVPASAPRSNFGVAFGRPPMVIEIYASPEFAADARYLAAALRAATVGMPIPPVLRRVRTRPTHLADWMFWLSAEPLPQGWEENFGSSQLWREAAGPGVADTAHLAAADASAAAVTVFRRDAIAADPNGETLWADGQGRPILSRQAWGHGAVYQLHTRLAPPWSELADDPQLPARLLALLQPEPTDDAAAALFHPKNPVLEQHLRQFDQRALDPTQLTAGGAVAAGPAPVRSAAGNFRFADWRPWLVLVAGLLFALERRLACRREPRPFTPLAS
ncbi:MAG: hypothetical protein M3Y54_06870, partial [Bacteroidota bacterium]|nr:hypothetical protein [Bacteroidota bacterium]